MSAKQEEEPEPTTAAAEEKQSQQQLQYVGEKLAPFNPTNVDAINIAIDLLQIQDNDRLYDLGCGDARFLIQACLRNKYVSGVGIEYDYEVFQRALKSVQEQDLQERITVIHDNVLNIDITEATVIFVYLVPDGLKKMKNRLQEALSRGARIVSYVFSIPEVTPVETVLYKSSTKIYLYKST